MLDEYVVREQARAAAQWQASCAADNALRRQINAQLPEGRLPSIHGVSKSHQGTGRPCLVCDRAIQAADVERVGIVLHAHEPWYVLWRQESSARRTRSA